MDVGLSRPQDRKESATVSGARTPSRRYGQSHPLKSFVTNDTRVKKVASYRVIAHNRQPDTFVPIRVNELVGLFAFLLVDRCFRRLEFGPVGDDILTLKRLLVSFVAGLARHFWDITVDCPET